MTCGICNPKAFRPQKGGRVYGYQTISPDNANCSGGVAPDLHYMGAEYVLTDWRKGNVTDRPSYQVLCNGVDLRKGDRLIVDSLKSFGSRSMWRRQNLARIEAMGVEVTTLTPEGRGMRYAS